MPTYEQLGFGQGASLSGDRARSVFGHVMGLVACALAFAAGGAYISRNMSGGSFLIFFILAFGGLFALKATVRRNNQNLATAMLMGVGLLFGLAIGPTVAYYAHTEPGVVFQAAGCTALFTAALGAFGASTQRDLSVYYRGVFIAFMVVLVFGLIAMFVAIPGSNIGYCVAMLFIFAFFTAFDFQRLIRNPSYQDATLIAANIFLDILNVFLLFLSLFGGGSGRR